MMDAIREIELWRAARALAVVAAAALLGGCLETGRMQMLPDSAAVRAPELPRGTYCTHDLGTDEIECDRGRYIDHTTHTYAFAPYSDKGRASLMPLDDGVYMYETYQGDSYYSYVILVTDGAFAELGVPADIERIAARHGVTVHGGSTVTDATRADYHAFLREVARRSEPKTVTIRRDMMADEAELRRALAELEALAAAEPPVAGGDRAVARRHLEEGERQMETDCTAAIAAFDRAIRLDPGNGRAYSVRGVCHRRLGDARQAIADQSQALELEPPYVYAYVRRAYVYSQEGLLGRARLDLDRAIERRQELNRSQRAMAYADRGALHETMGRPVSAAADYRKALALDPENTVAVEGLRRVDG